MKKKIKKSFLIVWCLVGLWMLPSCTEVPDEPMYQDWSAVVSADYAANAHRVKLQKTQHVITVTQGKSTYTLMRQSSPNIQLDTWRLVQQEINGELVWKEIDIEGPIKQKDTADFIGGYHGDEQMLSVTFYLDGIQSDLDAVWSAQYVDTFTVQVTSYVFYCDTQTPAFLRNKTLEFTDSTLTVSNKWEYIGTTPFTVLTHTGGGIWSIYCDLISGYRTNTDNTVKNNIGTAGSKELNCVTIYGLSGFTATVRGLSEIDEHYTADVSYFGKEPRPRIKPYFMTVYNTYPKTLKQGDIMESCFSICIK